MSRKKQNEVPGPPQNDDKPTKQERQLNKSVEHELDMLALGMDRWYEDD